jgi:hypothetical protein
MGRIVNASLNITASTSTTATGSFAKFADDGDPGFVELMCALGKLIVALNALEQEIKCATAFIIDPNTRDLMHPDVANKKPVDKRAAYLEEICRPKLSVVDADALKGMLDLVKGLANTRHALAHSNVYRSSEGFRFQKIERQVFHRRATPDDITEDGLTLLAWTVDFAKLFERLFPGYSSWYIRQTTKE